MFIKISQTESEDNCFGEGKLSKTESNIILELFISSEIKAEAGNEARTKII